MATIISPEYFLISHSSLINMHGVPNGTKLRESWLKEQFVCQLNWRNFQRNSILSQPPRLPNMLNLVPLGTPYLIPADVCVPKLRSNSAHPEFTPDVSSLAFLSGAVLYQNLSLASTTHRKTYPLWDMRTPLIHSCWRRIVKIGQAWEKECFGIMAVAWRMIAAGVDLSCKLTDSHSQFRVSDGQNIRVTESCSHDWERTTRKPKSLL